MMVLTRDEMLERWMQLRGVGLVRNDAVVERRDGVDLRGMMEAEMRRWYLGLLDNAPARLLPVTDIAGDVAVEAGSDGLASVRLPAGVRRVVGFRLTGWRADARLVAEDSDLWRRQAIAMARGATWCPVAMVDLGRRVVATLSAISTPAAVERLAVVLDPGPLSYVFDETLFPDLNLFPDKSS